MSYLSDMMQPSIRVALTKWSHTEPERGFEPGSAGYKATALPFELSSIDVLLKSSYEKYIFQPAFGMRSIQTLIEIDGWVVEFVFIGDSSAAGCRLM